MGAPRASASRKIPAGYKALKFYFDTDSDTDTDSDKTVLAKDYEKSGEREGKLILR